MIDVNDAETFFDADQYTDHASSRHPTVSISPNEIYAMHDVLLADVALVVRSLTNALAPRKRLRSHRHHRMLIRFETFSKSSDLGQRLLRWT